MILLHMPLTANRYYKIMLKEMYGKVEVNLRWKIVTFSVEAESIINSGPLTYADDDPNNDILTPSHLVCGRKLNDKCFTYNKDVTDPDELRTLAQRILLQKIWKRVPIIPARTLL